MTETLKLDKNKEVEKKEADNKGASALKQAAQRKKIVTKQDVLFKGRPDYKGVKFTQQTVDGIDFKTANCEGANFAGLDLTGKCFQGANLKGCDFTGANLTNTDVRWADFTDAKVDDVKVEGINAQEAAGL